MKASLLGVVPDGVYYQVFKAFNPKEIFHHLDIYKFHGLSPSPQV